MTTAKLTLGYVHVGRPQHGVSRYGRLLAAEARARPDLVVREAELLLEGGREENRSHLLRAAGDLAGTDVIHLQYNNQLLKSVWGPDWSQLANLWTFIRRVRAPVVVSVHDLFPPTSWPVVRQLVRTKIKLLGHRRLARLMGAPAGAEEVPRFALKSKVRRNLRPDAVTLRWLGRRRRQLMVCTEEERNRLTEFLPGAGVTVIPHFVEERVLPMRGDDAKRALGLGGMRVVTLLGYIHPRKGHALLVDAMPCLPPDVVVVVAGGAEPDHAAYLEQLLAAGRAAGNADRFRVTSYLPDTELDQYLAATDLAVCPFTATSASGSLSTWLSASKRILASDIPQIAEYNGMEPDAIATFSPYAPAALATAIIRVLATSEEKQLAAITRLRDRLHISHILDAHLEVYRQLRRPAGNGVGEKRT